MRRRRDKIKQFGGSRLAPRGPLVVAPLIEVVKAQMRRPAAAKPAPWGPAPADTAS